MSAKSLRGRFELPGDKSISHRLALLGALAEGETRIANYSTAADCSSMLDCLSSLGVPIERTGASVRVRGAGPDALREAAGPLDVGNSGTALRMLAGALAGRPFRSELTGDESIQRRPVERIAAPLREMGAQVETQDGTPPMIIQGGSLRGIEWPMKIASAQVKTAVLLAGLQASGTTTVREPARSRDHTERLLPLFGVPVTQEGLAVSVQGGARLKAATAQVPGDPSSAAFLVIAALIVPGSELRLDNVLLNPTRIAFLSVLQEMGAQIETGLTQEKPEPVGWIVARASKLKGTRIAGDRMPSLIDEVPALAVAAAFAEGRFTVAEGSELRVKESDRIAAVCEGLGRLGADVEENEDGFSVEGGRPLRGARVRSLGDHRIAMAFTIAGLRSEGPTEIDDAECASVSFPEFFELLERAQS